MCRAASHPRRAGTGSLYLIGALRGAAPGLGPASVGGHGEPA
jgi:hypothetical protein